MSVGRLRGNQSPNLPKVVFPLTSPKFGKGYCIKKSGESGYIDQHYSPLLEKLLTEIDDSASHKLDKVQKSEENIEKIKLEYDLLCWHNFYEKCHELEKSFYIKDDNYGLNVDVASREVVFNYG